jgi:hypothetical protein
MLRQYKILVCKSASGTNASQTFEGISSMLENVRAEEDGFERLAVVVVFDLQINVCMQQKQRQKSNLVGT